MTAVQPMLHIDYLFEFRKNSEDSLWFQRSYHFLVNLPYAGCIHF